MLKKGLVTKGTVLGVSILLLFSMLVGCSKTEVNPVNTTPVQVQIKDMAGREVTIPSNVKRILALHPIPSYFLFRLAPDKVVSKDSVFDGRYLGKDSVKVYSDGDREKLSKLPTTGVYFKGLEPEQLLQLKPDVIISLTKDPKINDLTTKVNIPIIAVSKDTMADYEETMRLIGKIVGNESEANKLADYWQKSIDEVKRKVSVIPSDKRVKVFFAGASGVLTTPGTQTIMASIVDTAGGDNVAKGLTGNQTGESLPVSLEQILKWNPEVVIVGTQKGKDQIMSDTAWKDITAVKNNKVFVQSRYASLDGVTALMGLVWLEGKLYTNDSEFNTYFESKMKEYYLLFHKYQITPDQIEEVAK
ncbi:ABC transporter substrate-binding protein [Desulfosporosinus sp. BG]|uniref:ABC transporter substrate-binding protein n=1 Tax=Desulfosporosinus sp. BG TaxID=1633135 RepID=UPI00083B2BCC|nr:ABC transporter substrate-binding protein [Desulfosporosinus sp. BG]ODA42029.1 Vitamin B12 ABC transporter, B12-binding component BtuF [Desulfosporosinus sp. BG]